MRRECPVQLPARAAISATALPCENSWNGLSRTTSLPHNSWSYGLWFLSGCLKGLHAWPVQGQWMLKLIERGREKLCAIISFPLSRCLFFIYLRGSTSQRLPGCWEFGDLTQGLRPAVSSTILVAPWIQLDNGRNVNSPSAGRLMQFIFVIFSAKMIQKHLK